MTNNESKEFHPAWKFTAPLGDRGILVASDSRLEWMLPWWWKNYNAHNDFPLSIIDLGMSDKAKKWCKNRATVYDFDYSDPLVFGKELVPDNIKTTLKQRVLVDDIWNVRKQWLKIPFALLQTPYKTTIWFDLDCEILGNLNELFEKHDEKIGVSMVQECQFSINKYIEDGILLPGDIMYNCGMIVYSHGIPMIPAWTKEIYQHNHLYLGNQHCLCHVRRQNGYGVNPLPNIYNWRMKHGANPHAKIIHWVSDVGKKHIANEIKKNYSK